MLHVLTLISFSGQLPVQTYTTAEGLPRDAVTLVRQDSRGFIWVAAGDGVLRFDGYTFTNYTTEDGLADRRVNDLLETRGGVYWVASQLGGLNRIVHPSADAPRFVRYTTADGLSSSNIRCITEDLRGHIYVGTGHGVDRLDTRTGVVKHYTAADGLPRGTIENAYRDRGGALWFGSAFGLSRFTAEQTDSGSPPTVYITGLRIGGVARRVSELGETSIPPINLPSHILRSRRGRRARDAEESAAGSKTASSATLPLPNNIVGRRRQRTTAKRGEPVFGLAPLLVWRPWRAWT
jgi:hypothetical protein